MSIKALILTASALLVPVKSPFPLTPAQQQTYRELAVEFCAPLVVASIQVLEKYNMLVTCEWPEE